MELYELQQWIGTLYDKIKTHKEVAEYEEYLLDKVTDPWPLSMAPKSLQESYAADISKQKEKENELLKLTEFDKELRTVDDILQKARLLYEQDEKLKAKDTDEKSGEKAETISEVQKLNKTQKPPNTTKNSKASLTSGRPKSGQGQVAMSRISRASKGATVVKTKPTSAGKQTISTRRVVNTKKVGNSVQDDKVNRHASQTKPTSTSKQTLSTKTLTNPKQPENFNHTDKASNGQASPSFPARNKELNHNVATSKQTQIPKPNEADLSKIKLSYIEVSEHLDLPYKTKKLLSTHSKLIQQSTESWKQLPTEEELIFIRNISEMSSGAKKDQSQILTLQSLNTELCHCLKVCNNAVNALKIQKRHKILSGSRQNLEYPACYNANTLKLAEEIYYFLINKYQHLMNSSVVEYDQFEDNFLDNLDKILLQSEVEDLTGFGTHEPPPEPLFTYENHTEISKWACEKLKQRFLITEREVLRKISHCFHSLLGTLSKKESSDLPTPEFIHVLQSAYGLLVDSNQLLPAYVVAE